MSLSVHYEMYQGVPLLSKWVSMSMSTAALQEGEAAAQAGAESKMTPLQILRSGSTGWTAKPTTSAKARFGADAKDKDVVVTSVVVEMLEVNAPFAPANAGSSGALSPAAAQGRLHVETDQAHSTLINWGRDEHWADETDAGANEPRLNTTYEVGPGVHLASVDEFTSFRTFELLVETEEMERQSLAQKQIVRRLAPWTSENPIFFHMADASSSAVRAAVDQMAEVGMVRCKLVIFYS